MKRLSEVATARNKIAWDLLHATTEYYSTQSQASTRGAFQFIEVPWLVSEKAIRSTFQGNIHEALPGQFAVGSAEQSFAQLLLDGELDPKEQYVALSPCFRDEPIVDELHQNHFMKVELIQPYTGTDDEDYWLAREAAYWFQRLADRYSHHRNKRIHVVKTPEGYDVTLNGIEVGSYGIRHFEGFSWVYGTALAEPRFSTAILK